MQIDLTLYTEYLQTDHLIGKSLKILKGDSVHLKDSQPTRDVCETSREGPLKFLTTGTSRGPSRDCNGTNIKIDDLMKKLFFKCNSPCFTHLSLFFNGKKYSKVLNGDLHRTSTGSSGRTSWGPNHGTFWRRPWEVRHTCFLNYTHKHIKLTLTGYSRLYSEWYFSEQCSV